jgi:hypothetical protein
VDQLRAEVKAAVQEQKGAACGGTLPRLLLVALISAFGALACSPPREGPGLRGTLESPDAVARAFLDALAERDVARFETLALSEAEFRKCVWPDLPSSRPEVGLPFDYAWRELRQKSLGYLSMTLARHGGTRYHLVRVEVPDPVAPYRTFAVHPRTRLVVRAPDGGEEAIRFFGSLIERDKRYKIFSYVND